ncbi:DUF2730 family protein [Shinella sp. G-2]|uniref:DUF2730 family protein n=1 Tax=Shinella sp. G-2 TaxID=3133141 RepID=UPI003D075C78
MMDVAPLVPWIGLSISIFTLFGLVRNALTSGEKKLEERLTKTESKLIDHDRRIQTVEGEMKHLPDRETAHNLQISMERIAGRLDTMDERLKPIAATNHRLQEYLLEQVGK